MSAARRRQDAKEQAETIAVCCSVSMRWLLLLARLGCLFRPGHVEILARCLHRATVFSSPARKIHAIKLFPFEPEAL
ncbi:MAG: hypothetical protein WAT78_05945 [Rhizobiaceae bacterium]